MRLLTLYSGILHVCVLSMGMIAVVGAGLATTPPLGFNTWNHFGCTGINASVLKMTADQFVELGLAKLGYTFVNSDDCWMLANRSDNGSGPQIPNPDKFPDGVAAVADYIHSKGLKLGLYTARANHTCAKFAASCMHERVDVAQWASWGVDYMKDDSCGTCRDVVSDYSAMQQAIWSVGREITMTFEGMPNISEVYTGCCGNARRVGHDIRDKWLSMTSLIDIGSGLWPFAHNGSKSANTSNPGGFWNDLDMIEVGNGDFVAEISDLTAAQARSHYSMWAVMKSVMLLGCDLSAIGPVTKAILTEPGVIRVNQDSLGIQARRISSIPPKNMTLRQGDHALGILAKCDSANPLQTWNYRSQYNHSNPVLEQLWIAACNVSDPAQKLSINNNMLVSKLTGQCLDAAESGHFFAKFARCTNTASEIARLNSTNEHLTVGGDTHCLDIFNNQGPNVFVGSCKAPGMGDDNQRFFLDSSLPGMIGTRLDEEKIHSCLTVRPPNLGGLLWTTTPSGDPWCLMTNGPQGEFSGYPCDPAAANFTPASSSQGFNLVPAKGDGEFTVTNIAKSYDGTSIVLSNTGRNQFGSSGPIPHSRWTKTGGGTFLFNPNSTIGSTLKSTNHAIIDDDNMGHVTVGGEFCLELSSAGALEVWVGELSGGRSVAALFNRSPAADSITLDLQHLPTADTNNTVNVYNVWSHSLKTKVSGSITLEVGAHDVALLIVCPEDVQNCM